MRSGTADEIKGRVKEAAGALADDDRLRVEGRIDQLVGKVKDVVGTVTETIARRLTPQGAPKRPAKRRSARRRTA